MTLSHEFHQRGVHRTALDAIAFTIDPHQPARQWNADHPNHPAIGDSFTIGYATATIKGLLDVLGYCDHGPNRFDCEWSLDHPYDPDDYLEDPL